jgi:4a-hydroxytetrahydrobiopterin dehydratase
MPYATPLTDAELADALALLPEWAQDGDTIRRSVEVADFAAAVALINAVAEAAEAADHHPDIHLTGYRHVSFEVSTHAAKALTRRDIELATEIDRLIAAA